MKKVLIIAITYNTQEETIRFVKSIAGQNYTLVDVLIVDNSDKSDPSVLEKNLLTIFPRILFLKAPSNLGYFGGAQLGLEFYRSSHTLPEWIIVSNVDLVFDQDKFFEKLNSLAVAPDTGVIAPSIFSKRFGTDANPKIPTRYTKKKMDFYMLVCTNALTQNFYITLSYLKKKLSSAKNKPQQNVNILKQNQPEKIYAPHGSCIIFNQNYFKAGGDLKHFSFLFGEEIFVAETARKLNLSVYYVPQLYVTDYEHASTGFFYSRKVAALMKQSTIDIINHYYKE